MTCVLANGHAIELAIFESDDVRDEYVGMNTRASIRPGEILVARGPKWAAACIGCTPDELAPLQGELVG